MAKQKAGTGVVVTGVKDIDAMLKEFEPKLQKAITRKATRAAAGLVLAGARMRVPVLTGELESSLKVRAMKKKKGSRRGAKFGHSVVTGGGFFSGDQFYGGFLEFSTKQRQHKSGKSVGQIEAGAWDYLRVSLYENEAPIRALFQSTMRSVIAEHRGKKTVGR